MQSPPAGPIVLYDSDCGFCRWALAKLLGWDRRRRLRPAAISSPQGERLLSGLDRDARLASWHLVLPDGGRLSSGAAAGPLLRELPGGRPFAALLERFPAATEAAYRWVVRNRSSLGRLIPGSAKRRAGERIRRHEARWSEAG